MNTTVAIVGGGPGGSTTASYLARHGIDSVIVEKATFPRFRVGEALTGEVGAIIRDLGLEEAMSQFAEKTAGIVVGPNGRNAFAVATQRRDPVLGLCPTTTWQVRRAAFDQMLLERAADNGVSVVNACAVEPVVEDGVVRGIVVEHDGGRQEMIHADVVVDASGPSTFLAQAGLTGPKERGQYARQIAVYSHYAGAQFDPDKGATNTHIYYKSSYHWAWFIPMGGDTVSVGVVTPSDYYRDSGEGKEAFIARELRELNPGLAERSATLEKIEDVHVVSNFSYQIPRFTGSGFICVGDAHRFLDPIFAFGVHFTMVEGRRAADTIAECLSNGGPATPGVFDDHERICEIGQDIVQSLVDGFWWNPFAFAIFVHRRYTDDFTDLFAGRVYQEEPSPGVQALRNINKLAAGRTYY